MKVENEKLAQNSLQAQKATFKQYLQVIKLQANFVELI